MTASENTGPNRTHTTTHTSARARDLDADIRDRFNMAYTESLVSKVCLSAGIISLLVAFGTAGDPDLRPVYGASLTGVMLSGGLSITWVVVHALRALCRLIRHLFDLGMAAVERLEAANERRHNELMAGFTASGQRYAQLIQHIEELTQAQNNEAKIVSDVLCDELRKRREGRG